MARTSFEDNSYLVSSSTGRGVKLRGKLGQHARGLQCSTTQRWIRRAGEAMSIEAVEWNHLVCSRLTIRPLYPCKCQSARAECHAHLWKCAELSEREEDLLGGVLTVWMAAAGVCRKPRRLRGRCRGQWLGVCSKHGRLGQLGLWTHGCSPCIPIFTSAIYRCVSTCNRRGKNRWPG